MQSIQGYMIDVDYDDETITAKGRNKAAPFALVGASLREDQRGMVVPDQAVIPLADIATVDHKPGNPLVNGHLTLTTTTGQKYQLHFRRKSNADFAALHEAICTQRPDLR